MHYFFDEASVYLFYPLEQGGCDVKRYCFHAHSIRVHQMQADLFKLSHVTLLYEIRVLADSGCDKYAQSWDKVFHLSTPVGCIIKNGSS